MKTVILCLLLTGCANMQNSAGMPRNHAETLPDGAAMTPALTVQGAVVMGQSWGDGARHWADGAGESGYDCGGHCVLCARDCFTGAEIMRVIVMALLSTTAVLATGCNVAGVHRVKLRVMETAFDELCKALLVPLLTF
jgi:hypothetical protein